jgi:hypothetical protein
MSVKFLAIQSEPPKTWHVKLEIDGKVVDYRFMREDFQVDGRAAFGISSEPAFRQTFRFNHPMLKHITDLLISVAQGDSLRLPIDLGELALPSGQRLVPSRPVQFPQDAHLRSPKR